MQWGETKALACACDAAVGVEAARRREATGRHRERMRARVEEMVGEGDTRKMEPGLRVRRHDEAQQITSKTNQSETQQMLSAGPPT
jgi:hypothetical protein